MLSNLQVFAIAGQSIKIGERFVHAAVFGVEHTLHLLFGQASVAGVGPVGELPAYLDCLLAAALDVHVKQAGTYLV